MFNPGDKSSGVLFVLYLSAHLNIQTISLILNFNVRKIFYFEVEQEYELTRT